MVFHMFLTPSPIQIVVVLVLGVLFFGKNLPEVAKRIGMSLLELRKGMNDLGDIVKDSSISNVVEHQELTTEKSELESNTEKYSTYAPKFDPPQISS